jgi:hypothetical protein
MNTSLSRFSTRPAPRAAALLAAVLALSGCVSTKYKMARKDTPPPVPLNLVTTQPPVEAALNTLIVYQGPGSWKRAAFWDEYVVTLHNQGEQPLTIAAAALTDFTGVERVPGDDPWALEKQSKVLERKYRDGGVAFMRNATPVVLIVGAGAAVGAEGAFVSAAVLGSAVAVVYVLPVYYLTVLTINHYDKNTIMAEFTRRRLVLPLVLAPGETRTGSLFFPMVPNPRALSLRWSSGAATGAASLSLESLHGLHVKAPESQHPAGTPPA